VIIVSRFQMRATKGICISEQRLCWSLESSLLLNLVSENGELSWLIDQITGWDGLLSGALNRQSESADRGWFDNRFGILTLFSNRWSLDQKIEISVFSSLMRRRSVSFWISFRKNGGLLWLIGQITG
jgi:hypothetical protein